jgi:hypothetical protein
MNTCRNLTLRLPQLRRLGARLLELGVAGVLLGAVVHHVFTLHFRPLAVFFLPLLVAFFGFTSLLYMRGRSLRRGKAQIRTMYAAERSMQATVWYLTGIVLAMAIYGLLQIVPFRFDPREPTLQGLWLLAFAAPYALMQAGLVLFMRAAWIVASQMLRRVTPYEVWRRIKDQDEGLA